MLYKSVKQLLGYAVGAVVAGSDQSDTFIVRRTLRFEQTALHSKVPCMTADERVPEAQPCCVYRCSGCAWYTPVNACPPDSA